MSDHRSFWATVPGILTAIATLVTAVTGLLLALRDPPPAAVLPAVTSANSVPAAVPKPIELRASEYDLSRGVWVEDGRVNSCAVGLVYNAPDFRGKSVTFRDKPNMVEYSFTAAGGPYYLTIVYANADRDPRPVRVTLNEELISASALQEPSGSWCADRTIDGGVGKVQLKNGINTLRIERSSTFPHLKLIRFKPAG